LEYGDFKCPWIDPKALWQRVEEVRRQYWPEGSVPVDIEAIVEIRLKLLPDPVHGLQSQLDVDAYLKGRPVASGWLISPTFHKKTLTSNPWLNRIDSSVG
jgi:hypothetical protein